MCQTSGGYEKKIKNITVAVVYGNDYLAECLADKMIILSSYLRFK
jgi:hypothetical protein